MTRVDVQAMIDRAQQQSVALYLRRQMLEQQLRQLQAQAAETDRQLVQLDGAIEALTNVLAQMGEA